MQTNTNAALAIASVPTQKWGQVYPEESVLSKGTIFPDLNMPFYVTEGMMDTSIHAAGTSNTADPRQQGREQLLSRINEVSFFLDDLRLYLDTHIQDKEALKLFAKKGNEREQLMTEFAREYYPLTANCIAKCSNAAEENLWAKGPNPWEGACV